MLKFLTAIALWFPLSMYKAFVVMKLFNWHVVPAFNFHQLEFVYSWGITTLITLLVIQSVDDENDNLWMVTLSTVVKVTMFFGMGYVISLLQ
jgi:hypothetical protein